MLSDGQIERYSRQLILPEVGAVGQQKLLDSSVALLAERGVGRAALLYLAAAGVGYIRTTEVARDLPGALAPSNPDIRVIASRLDEEELEDLVERCQVVVADDSAPCARINAACVARGVPLVFACVRPAQGLVTVFAGHRKDAPCYACAPEVIAVDGGGLPAIRGATAGLIGTLAATEVLKLLLDVGSPLLGRATHYDARESHVRVLRVGKRPACEVCGEA